jgi:hypothetical protein
MRGQMHVSTPALNVAIQRPAPTRNTGMSLILINHAEVGRWLCKAHAIALYRTFAPRYSMTLTIVGLGTVLYSIACSSPPPNWPAYPPRWTSNPFGIRSGSHRRTARPTLTPVTHECLFD